MTFVFRSVVEKTTSVAARQLKEQLGKLRKLIQIDSAEAILERGSHPRSAFRLQVHLAVPGPDLRVESTGYTVPEAILKVEKELVRRIEMRRLRRRDVPAVNVRRPAMSGK